MRINQYKRILMSEVDSGSGNGAVAPAPTEQPPAEPQAQGASTPLTLEALSKVLEERDQKLHDRLFAAVRRDGGFSKKEKTPTSESPTTPKLAPDAMQMRALDRALAKHGLADKLSDSQYKRVERLFIEESPDDVGVWVKDYFDGFGGAPQPVTASQAAPAAAKPVSEHPVSNRGAPPPAQVALEEIDLFSASDSDRAAFIKSKGPKAYVAQLQKQAKGRPVRLG